MMLTILHMTFSHICSHVSTGGALLTALVGGLHHLHVGGGVVGLDVGVDGLLDQALLELCLGQLAPHGRLVAALRKLVGAVQVADVLDQHLREHGKHIYLHLD